MEKKYAVVSYEVPYGWPSEHRRMRQGYVLENGIVLQESEKEKRGNYKGGAGMDGMYMQTFTSYEPVFEDDKIIAFVECEKVDE